MGNNGNVVVWAYRPNRSKPWIRKSAGEFPTTKLAQEFIKRYPSPEGEFPEIIPADVTDPEAYLKAQEAVA